MDDSGKNTSAMSKIVLITKEAVIPIKQTTNRAT
jgi:hypothetical protein